MTRRYNMGSRTEAAVAIFDIDSFWAKSFADTNLNDLNYCDLFTQMWLKRDRPLAKTELYELMPNISRRTAVKYVQKAIDQGLLDECESEQDRRVRLVSMSADCLRRVDRFLDFTCQRFAPVGL
ncbi:MarR family transcriptional regulator [Alcanivorax sp. 1008]|uniref:MarR family transcriptional regulator n=1 Tax=Alcanivorax sp. 1008 TaxID=2816853 RepID=UPI001E645E5A|nr:MarR family transcriptional regulator [Alcanivorax sp. 1008]